MRNKDNFTGKIYAYNYRTKKKDRIFTSAGECLYEEALKPYLSDSAENKKSYHFKESNEYRTAPGISLIYKE